MNIESLPDFDDMDKMARTAADAKAKLEDSKNFLDSYIADCVKAAMLVEDYWVGGKPPTASYCNSVIAIVGNNEEDKRILRETREEIVQQTYRYQEAKMLLDNMKDRISIFQTISANGRKVNL